MSTYRCLHISSICRQVLVADATVGQVLPSCWNTPDGLKPALVDFRSGAKIYTPVRFSRMNILVDNRRIPTEEFTFSGGTMGADSSRQSVLTSPLLERERYFLVFIPGLDIGASEYTQQWLIVYAACPIDDQEMVTQRGHVTFDELYPPGQAFTPLEKVKIPLAQLARRLSSGGDSQS